VLFFDEFDAIGKERGDTHDTSEIKRVVSSLPMQVDELPSYTVVIAATNHAELLDRAVWRRFQLPIELPEPKSKELATFIDRFLSRFDEPPGMTAETLARKLGPVSFSEAEQFRLDVLRRHVLATGETRLRSLLAEQLKICSARVGAPPGTTEEVSRAETSPQTSESGAR
jgi:SpoVK/Ycf46/Vps4 family AAA+-type ATPase